MFKASGRVILGYGHFRDRRAHGKVKVVMLVIDHFKTASVSTHLVSRADIIVIIVGLVLRVGLNLPRSVTRVSHICFTVAGSVCILVSFNFLQSYTLYSTD